MSKTLRLLSGSSAVAFTLFLAAESAVAQQPIQPRMGQPVQGLDAAQMARFTAGRAAFDNILNPATGLGPNFNDTFCTHCHLQPAGGGASTVTVTRFGKAASGMVPFDPLDALGGSLLQRNSINTPTCDEVVPPQADVQTLRLTTPVFGAGLVEAISDADILVREAFPPPGVSGKTHMVHSFEDMPGFLRAGRFGWKSQVATLLTFSADASLNEMGLTNRFLPQENAPNGDLVRLAMCDTVPDPEDHPDGQGYDMIDRQRDFQAFLAPPPQTPRSGMSGEAIFNAVGCGACHVSTPYTTLPTAEPGLANKTLKPYSDFLLHDMGTLGDGIAQGAATETEIRTSPLWGVGQRAHGLALLHDGRAAGGTPGQNLESAILYHDGEAAASRGLYVALSAADKVRLQNFLISLGQAEFDFEYNNNVDEIDWFFLRPMMTGPGTYFDADSTSAIADFDQDGDFDLRDIAALQRAFTGT